ncbi:hypothetical protein BDV33DRAFT_163009 [Aspergillus novoparasiticus]|uniref:Uncharacterized protein n=1 Tax=Aspergillus novoparasiticus TaxID=986946 RepID=A0A5N6F8D8_9EURO|nr:hypothetical protein BDV33DRAFT_163009 [Aspergillus novoparasiticus]
MKWVQIKEWNHFSSLAGSGSRIPPAFFQGDYSARLKCRSTKRIHLKPLLVTPELTILPWFDSILDSGYLMPIVFIQPRGID